MISLNRGYCPHGFCGQECKNRQKQKLSFRSDGTKYKNPNSNFKGGCVSCDASRFAEKCCSCKRDCLFDNKHACPKIKTFAEQDRLKSEGKIVEVKCSSSGCKKNRPVYSYELEECGDCKKKFCMLCLTLYYGSDKFFCEQCFNKKTDEEKKKMTTEPRIYVLCFICGKKHILLSAGKHKYELETNRYYHNNCLKESEEDGELKYDNSGLIKLKCLNCNLEEGDKGENKKKLLKETVLGWYEGTRLSCLGCFNIIKKWLEKN